MNSRLPLALAVITSCFSIFAVTLLIPVSADESDCTHCTPGPNNGSVANAQLSSWPAGATVTVYIDPAFAQVQGGVQAIKNAFTNWSNAGGSGVTFQFSSTPVSGQKTYTVTQQQPSLGPNYQAETGGGPSGGHRSDAFTNIDPGNGSCGAHASDGARAGAYFRLR